MAEVELDGLGTQHELVGDLAVRHPRDDEPCHRELLRREGGVVARLARRRREAAGGELRLAALQSRLRAEPAEPSMRGKERRRGRAPLAGSTEHLTKRQL